MKEYDAALLADMARSTDDPAHLDSLARHMLNLPPPPLAVAQACDLPLPDLPVPAPVGAWRRALDDAIAADPRGKLGVAERLGVSRPYVSRVTTGDIPVASPRFVQRVVDTYLQVDCPHLQRTLPPGQCRAYAARGYAQISQDEVPHWRACRRCALNPLHLKTAAAEAAGDTSHTTSHADGEAA